MQNQVGTMPFSVLLAVTLLGTSFSLFAEDVRMLQAITFVSSADQTPQSAMFYAPAVTSPAPLVVALHTWAGDYRQTFHDRIAQACIAKGWAYIHPDFRGPNNRPEAAGSDLAVSDIVDAVAYAKTNALIDAKSIFLVGSSGGGMAALLMAGRHPEIWAGVSAWVPISDLRAWHEQGRYRATLELSCSGAPGTSAAVDEEYRKRSPLTYLAQAKNVPLHINAGIRDGHDGSVPVSHSLLAFNLLADPADRLSPEDIAAMTEQAEIPVHLQREIFDPSYGAKQPLFRRTSGNVTVTLFKGGHELVATAALAWIESLYGRGSKEK